MLSSSCHHIASDNCLLLADKCRSSACFPDVDKVSSTASLLKKTEGVLSRGFLIWYFVFCFQEKAGEVLIQRSPSEMSQWSCK